MGVVRNFGVLVAAAASREAAAGDACVRSGHDGSCVAHASMAKDSVLLQINRDALIARHVQSSTEDKIGTASCCDGCAGQNFCSPVSGSCYETKNKDYYRSCSTAEDEETNRSPVASDCCARCSKGVAGFCSPQSGNCYLTQRKDYYQSCPDGGDVEIVTLPRASSSQNSIKFMSYNLFGWNAFNRNEWRSKNVLSKIADWSPAVYGAQEVERGGSSGYHYVRDKVMDATGLTEIGGSQFFDESSLEKHEQAHFALKRGYWMSMTRFTQKSSGQSFLFFNSHWKHGYGLEQARIVARAVAEQREKYGPLPTVLVGDTNQFCRAYETDAIKYLKAELDESPPVKFVDAIAHDSGKSFSDGHNPDCRVDFILASEGQWQLVNSYIDREGMGEHGSASDHAALMAELVPVADNMSPTQ